MINIATAAAQNSITQNHGESVTRGAADDDRGDWDIGA
jgi:hypothetical protein